MAIKQWENVTHNQTKISKTVLHVEQLYDHRNEMLLATILS